MRVTLSPKLRVKTEQGLLVRKKYEFVIRELYMTDMFRLLSLSILHHHVLGNIGLDFFKNSDENIVPNNIYTSVVIGANGIGKSYLMRAIADIFSYLDTL